MLAAIAMTALSACGSSKPAASTAKSDPTVATLVSTAAAPSSSPSTKTERPRERLDTTSEEFEAMLGPYNKCLKEHGFDQSKAKRAADAAKMKAGPESEKVDAANRLCESQFYPLPPWEKDPANPEARDFALAVVKCLKAKGIEYVEVSDDGISIALGGDQNDSRSITRGLELMPECERKAAAQTK